MRNEEAVVGSPVNERPRFLPGKDMLVLVLVIPRCDHNFDLVGTGRYGLALVTDAAKGSFNDIWLFVVLGIVDLVASCGTLPNIRRCSRCRRHG